MINTQTIFRFLDRWPQDKNATNRMNERALATLSQQFQLRTAAACDSVRCNGPRSLALSQKSVPWQIFYVRAK